MSESRKLRGKSSQNNNRALPLAEQVVFSVRNRKLQNIKHGSESWERELSAFSFILTVCLANASQA